MDMDAELCREEIHWGSNQYIHQVNTSDGHILQVTDHMCRVFQQDFQNWFTKEAGLSEQDLHSYLIDFPWFLSPKAAGHEGEITDVEVSKALKMASSRKPPGFDGVSYKLYEVVTHICTYLDNAIQ